MQSWPLGVKIGAGLVVVALAVVVWVGLRPSPPSPGLGSPDSEPVDLQRSGPAEQGVPPAAGGRPVQQGPAAGGQPGVAREEFRAREFPRGQIAPVRPGAPAVEMPEAAAPGEDDEEPSFESLQHLALSDPDSEKRAEAIMMLADSENPAALSVIAQALNDPDPEVRLTAVETLGDFEGPGPIDALAQALNDADPEVRFEALGLLADIGGDAVRPAVEKALHDQDEDVRALAEEVLGLEDPRDTEDEAASSTGGPTK